MVLTICKTALIIYKEPKPPVNRYYPRNFKNFLSENFRVWRDPFSSIRITSNNKAWKFLSIIRLPLLPEPQAE